MAISSNNANTSSLCTLEESIFAQLEYIISIIGKVSYGQLAMYTQRKIAYTNITTMDTANTLLSDTLNNKIESLTNHVASRAPMISSKRGTPLDVTMTELQKIHNMQITHTHTQNSINNIGLLPQYINPNHSSPTHTHVSSADTGGGFSG